MQTVHKQGIMIESKSQSWRNGKSVQMNIPSDRLIKIKSNNVKYLYSASFNFNFGGNLSCVFNLFKSTQTQTILFCNSSYIIKFFYSAGFTLGGLSTPSSISYWISLLQYLPNSTAYDKMWIVKIIYYHIKKGNMIYLFHLLQ